MSATKWRYVRQTSVPGERVMLLSRTGPAQFVALIRDGAVYVGRRDE